MLNAIRRYFEDSLRPGATEDDEAELQHKLRLATAALLLEVTRADFEVSAEERFKVQELVQTRFELSLEETRELVALADQEVDYASSLTDFTRLINENYGPEQKIKIIELLWRVAFADVRIDKHEDHLVRKIADLLYVSHRDFIRTKHQAIESMNG